MVTFQNVDSSHQLLLRQASHGFQMEKTFLCRSVVVAPLDERFPPSFVCLEEDSLRCLLCSVQHLLIKGLGSYCA
ncbi:unnamed protein product [Tetraodon nigroviridis]|uniref:(spotted green pufferfish) hypothetical protein n=1 Tax=Tetraodon nigroviridis TaxID=99883 RepID=Q4RFQ7_TETNG|nr:unnamed protein product [Tetraodon nigroviridis]